MGASNYTIRRANLEELPAAAEIDNATDAMFRDFGLLFELAETHPFVAAERERWRRALLDERLYWALSDERRIGFYVLGDKDEQPYLDQLSVHPDYGGRGIGRALLEHAWDSVVRRGGSELSLTTYAHVPWNGPFYARVGFQRLSEPSIGPELLATLVAQREVLPQPEQRIAMRRDLAPAERVRIQRGDLFWIRSNESRGSVSGYSHPHVVVQDDVFNRSRIPTVVVCALTTNLQRMREPGNVLLDVGEGNLPAQSGVIVSQISVVEKALLATRIGALSAARVEQILTGLRFQQRAYFER